VSRHASIFHSGHERAFREGLAQRRLLYACCPACGKALAYTQRLCPQHPRVALEWRPASGRASLHTFTVYRIAYADRQPPYAVAIVQLQEGPRLSCTLPADQELQVGMPLQARFDSAGSLLFHTNPGDRDDR
jgi:uncharacterized OB-fold protein